MTRALRLLTAAALLLVGPGHPVARGATPSVEPTLAFGVLGMPENAVRALAAHGADLGVRVTGIDAGEPVGAPELCAYDALILSLSPGRREQELAQAIRAARAQKPGLALLCVAPAPFCARWGELLGEAAVDADPALGAYYGLSRAALGDLLRYILVARFGRPGPAPPPGGGSLVQIYHPDYGELPSLDALFRRARADGWRPEQSPRVALGTWRHHVLFHQPKVVDALIRELARQGILAVCLVADDPGFAARLAELEPALVIMTSHTREAVELWQKLAVPRLHALWFTSEGIEAWQRSNDSGMAKSSIFHQLASAEAKGATECLTAGGTLSGHDSGEEIVPIPDRVQRIAARARAWIDLQRKTNAEKKLAIVIFDREADKAGLLSGPAHALNAPRSLVRLLHALEHAGYTLSRVPADEQELLSWVVARGRQMGAWEPAALDRLARSGAAVLVPEERYRAWFTEHVPDWRRAQVIAQWGESPGEIMVWRQDGRRFLVLPRIDLGNVVLLTQPLKGETLTATAAVESPDESLLPPTHHYLATYFWLQHELGADAVLHFGTHGSEWLFPGKPAVLSRADWGDILIGDVPNINPWLMSNTAELLPCRRRAMALTVGHLPPLLTDAGLPDDLLNLESSLNKYASLDRGALRREFAEVITTQARAAGLIDELGLTAAARGRITDDELERLAAYLHDLANLQIPTTMHVLGVPPPDTLRLPALARAMGKPYLDATRALYRGGDGEPTDELLLAKAREVLTGVLRHGLTPAEAIRRSGGHPPAGELPAALREPLALAAQMDAGFDQTPEEITAILAALAGRFIPPGPAGSPERDVAVVPSGRALMLNNPSELPTRASWELGTRLLRDYLAAQLRARGRYPEKVAFSLIPYATFADYGVVESQILYLMGVRPVWDAKERVTGVELIPAAELGRPRIDVFLSARSVYRDELPSLMQLLDRAIRLVATLPEPGNQVHQHTVATRRLLEKKGMPAARAQILAQARMFGAEPAEVIDSHNWFFYLSERSGEWETRDDLLEVYLRYCRHAYTDGAWGEQAPDAFAAAIQGTELILRSWYDSRDVVLNNKFAWWVDGTLSLTVEHLTGRTPELLFVDVRNPDDAELVDSTVALQQDLRARLTNPRWIRGMMQEGYAGGNAVAKTIDNLMGWEITRERSVTDADWSTITDVYIRDRAGLGVRDWFEASNPHALQKVAVTLLETSRKGFWAADARTREELARVYAESVVRHGPVEGIRAGGNAKLAAFVDGLLAAPGRPELTALRQAFARAGARAPGASPEMVRGHRLEKVSAASPTPLRPAPGALVAVVASALLLVAAGFVARGVVTRRQELPDHD